MAEGTLVGDRVLRWSLAALSLLSVAPLLAWVYGLGQFSSWYWRVTVPALAIVAGAAVVVARSPSRRPLHHAFVAGTVGGVVGTIGYDVVRLPFLAGGLRLLAPIDSYGVLMLDAVGSSGRTGTAGWVFHAANGICFGIAYALVAAGRSWRWALLWAMVLETATVVSPFASLYGLRQKPELIVIAYLAHIPFGFAVGKLAQDPAATVAKLAEIAPRFGASLVLGATVAAVLLWQRPWSTPDALAEGERVAPGPSAVIHGDRRMSPSWVRVPEGGCAVLRNDMATAAMFAGTTIQPGADAEVCFAAAAVKRVKIDGKDWSGGFVIVDAEQEP